MLKSTHVAQNKLPPGWTQHKAPSGHLYYYNAETKQSTYKRPSAPPTDSQPSLDLPNRPPVPYGSAFSGPAAFNYGYAMPQTFPGPNFGDNFNRTDRDDPGNGFQRRRQPEDQPKHKYPIPDCAPWVLVKTRLGRRFVHNPDTNESLWKFPQHVMKGVVEYDRLERERKERREQGEQSEVQKEGQDKDGQPEAKMQRRDTTVQDQDSERRDAEESDEYEEVEVTDDEDEEFPSKKPRGDEEDGGAVEFNEDDIAYQLAAMGEEYGLDPGEYGEPGEEGWEEGAEGLPLTEEDTTALFRDLLDDYRINPYTPWERIIEEGKIIDDTRYTVLPNMKSRRDVWSAWSRDRIQELKERKKTEEKKDPRITYLSFLQERATPKLYWPEFKRKYRKEPEMKDPKVSDRDREKFYRDHISRLKMPEDKRKSDLSALLKSIPVHTLNNSSSVGALPPSILSDLRYISLPPKIRDPLIETYISTLPAAPEKTEMSVEEQEEQRLKKLERQKREQALADRESKVQEQKRMQKGALMHGKTMLRHGEAELERAMRVGKEGLKSHMESTQRLEDQNGT